MTHPPASGQQQGRRRIIPVAALLLCMAVFSALGVWQVQRLAWKRALIAHVEAALHAAPVEAGAVGAAPSPAALADLEYRRVALQGAYVAQGTTLVAALTDLGGGYWAMTPLRMADGRILWVNRGFVPAGSRREGLVKATPAQPVRVIGLLRKSEPSRWLRPNNPAANRWYARDLAAIAAARQLPSSQTAWFIDAQSETPASPGSPIAGLPVPGLPVPGLPVPGLTVVQFANNHLSYAITWFLLAALCLVGIRLVIRPSP